MFYIILKSFEIDRWWFPSFIHPFKKISLKFIIDPLLLWAEREARKPKNES